VTGLARTLATYARTRWLQRRLISRADIEMRQRLLFERFADRVLSRSPWYMPFAGKPLAAYPVIGKAIALDAFDRMNTRGLHRDTLMRQAQKAEASRDFSGLASEFSVGLSSGTSGERGLFVASARERATYAGILLAKALPRSLFHAERVALLFRANNPLYEAAGGSARLSFGFYDLSKPFGHLLTELDAYRPTILIGPPQALLWVAQSQSAGRIRIAPRKIIAGGEVLEADVAHAIGSTFDRAIDQIYQATEGFLGLTCAHNTLHLNEDYLIVEREWIDRKTGRFMPIVTDLMRETQPTVRYRLDDILIERASPCPCGSPLLAINRIEGRADDALLLAVPDGRKLVPVMPDFVRDALGMLALGEYRVVQHDPKDIEVSLTGAATPAAPHVAAALIAVFAHAGAAVPTIRFRETAPADLTRKFRRVERRFPAPAGFEWSAS
jgi:putative adenylate-forming enzyme